MKMIQMIIKNITQNIHICIPCKIKWFGIFATFGFVVVSLMYCCLFVVTACEENDDHDH